MKLLLSCYVLSCWLSAVTVAQTNSWYKFGSTEYYIHRGTSVVFSKAEQACTSMNATIARVKTTALHDFLLSQITATTQWLFIGLNRKNSGFQWNDGTSITSGDTHWRPGEPGTSEKCVEFQLNYDRQSYEWNDIPCTDSRGYICERLTESTFNGSSVETVKARNTFMLVDVMYKMCFNAAPYKVEASARMLNESYPHRFNVTTMNVQPYFFRVKLERIDLNQGWSTSKIYISWKAYFKIHYKKSIP